MNHHTNNQGIKTSTRLDLYIVHSRSFVINYTKSDAPFTYGHDYRIDLTVALGRPAHHERNLNRGDFRQFE